MNYKKLLTPLSQSIGSVLGFLLILATIIRATLNDNVALLTIVSFVLLLFLSVFVMKHYIEIAEIKLKQNAHETPQAQPAQEPHYPPLEIKIQTTPPTYIATRLKVLSLLKVRNRATRSDFLQVLEGDESSLDDCLTELEKMHLIIQRGEDCDDYYELTTFDDLGSDDA